MVIAAEIEGVGYALACDFLKELGFRDYGKPDVHLKQIFAAVGWCPKGASDYEVQKTIVKVADELKVTPYHVDKLFWLLGSGYLYEHQHLGRKGRIGSKKKEFIQDIRKIIAKSGRKPE